MDSLLKLRSDEYLAAWDNGYDRDGIWQDGLAKTHLEAVTAMRRRAKAAQAGKVLHSKAARAMAGTGRKRAVGQAASGK